MIANKRRIVLVLNNMEVTFDGSPSQIAFIEDFLLELRIEKRGFKYVPLMEQVPSVLQKLSHVIID